MSQIASDFKAMMRGTVSMESAVLVPNELSTDLPMDKDDVLEIREERSEIDQELEAMISVESDSVKPILQTVGAVAAIADGASAVDSVTADSYVPIVNASMEQFQRLIEIDIPKLTQELNGHVSLESIDSLKDWVTQSAASFKISAKNFFARIALWWRRQFVTAERLRKRLNSVRARQGSRKGTGGKDLKLGKYAGGLIQGDGFATDPLAALAAEGTLSSKLVETLLAAQGSVAETLTSRLDQLLATDRPASAMFRQDLTKIIADLEAALKSQPTHLLGNMNLVTDKDDGDFMLLQYIQAAPNADAVAKNAAPAKSLSPEAVSSYLDALDTLLEATLSSIRGIEKESARVCKIAETAVERVGSKYTTQREMQSYGGVDEQGKPVWTTETETTSTLGRVMETEYEIVEVINGLSWTINVIVAHLMYTASSVLTLVEESVIQD